MKTKPSSTSDGLYALKPYFQGAIAVFAAYIVAGVFIKHIPGQYGLWEVITLIVGTAFYIAMLALPIGVVWFGWYRLTYSHREQFQRFVDPRTAIVILIIFGAISTTVITHSMHRAAVSIWMNTPFGLSYYDANDLYNRRCTTKIQDDNNESHYGDDWHDGARICRSLAAHVKRAFPGPAWLFGDPPHFEPE